jgi:hypothetical protein
LWPLFLFRLTLSTFTSTGHVVEKLLRVVVAGRRVVERLCLGCLMNKEREETIEEE